jgi:hypothetical protein
MVRTPLRVVFATWTLVALIVTSVGPAVNSAWAEASGQRADHACCPQAVSESAPVGRQPVPLPCCAVGNASQQVPAIAPAPVRSGTPNQAAVLTPSWTQSLLTSVGAPPHVNAARGPIPLVLRTSVLLI